MSNLDDLIPTPDFLDPRFELGSTVPGTRSFHVFVPQDVGVISYKRTADDESFSGTFDFYKSTTISVIKPKMQDYVVASYDEHWWAGVVIGLHRSNNERCESTIHDTS